MRLPQEDFLSGLSAVVDFVPPLWALDYLLVIDNKD
jgi:hypothetical protein